jgi:hypothetical protein
MTIENIASEIVEKLPELVRDNPLNAQDTITGIIKNNLRNSAVECAWRYDSNHDYYDTQCGDGICFTEGTVNTNKYRFCPTCGGTIKLIETACA